MALPRPAYVALSLLDTALSASRRPVARRARWVTKPLLMPALAATRPLGDATLATSTRVAQGFSWGGDVALLGPGTKPFLVGAGSFGVAHLASLAGFVRVGDPSTSLRSRPSTKLLAGFGLLAAPLLAARAARKDPVIGAVAAAYAGLLVTTAAHALHLDPALPRQARLLTGAGMVLFVVSDTALAVRAFGPDEPGPRLGAVVMATYTAAQLLLAEGAARS